MGNGRAGAGDEAKLESATERTASSGSRDWQLFDNDQDHDSNTNYNNNDADDEDELSNSSIPRSIPGNNQGYSSSTFRTPSLSLRINSRHWHEVIRNRELIADTSAPVPPRHGTPVIMASSGASPSRLPSPPPFPEVQIGPQSPIAGGDSSVQESLFATGNTADTGSTRRIRPGTKAEDMASGPPLVPLSQLDSPFQLQEHLKALYHHHTKPPNSDVFTPITRDIAQSIATPPEGVERSLWLYELCRFLTMKANNLIIAFFAETPPCSSVTCPEMRASEWQYLCAVHDPPKSCCAIDYCCHTLDWASNILTSPKYFPSRLHLGSDASGGPQASMRHLTNIFRRVYRIFAHAWFQHREIFWNVEGHDGLYMFFKTVCDVYSLIPEDNYTIPKEAEGSEPSIDTPVNAGAPSFNILRKSDAKSAESTSSLDDPASDVPTTISTGATTRRHKHTPSTGAAVTTIVEGPEEEDTKEQETNETLPEVEEEEDDSSEESEEDQPTQIPEEAAPESETSSNEAKEEVTSDNQSEITILHDDETEEEETGTDTPPAEEDSEKAAADTEVEDSPASVEPVAEEKSEAAENDSKEETNKVEPAVEDTAEKADEPEAKEQSKEEEAESS